MIFGLPGAALATVMYRCAKPEKKKAAGGLLLSAALACMLTGITEPLEFFLPVCSTGIVCSSGCTGRFGLYDRAYAEYRSRTDILRWILDFFLFGILQGNEKTSWMRVIPVGIIYFILYYVIFTFLIKKI